MGSETFYQISEGKNDKDAFNNAITQAVYDHGHSGYTGTIAEKDSFIYICEAKTHSAAIGYARKLVSENDDRIDDKWGPAGCIHISNTNKYLFFGWASS